MTTSIRPLTLTLLLSSGLGLIALTGGCTTPAAYTPTPSAPAQPAPAPTAAESAEAADDAAINQRVKAAFGADSSSALLGAAIVTFKRVVYLSGPVGSLAEKSRATQLARTIPGVIDVTNNMIVKP